MRPLNPIQPFYSAADAPTALSFLQPQLGASAHRQQSLAEITQAALLAKPPRANLVSVKRISDDEMHVRYDRFTTGEKVAIGAGVAAAGAAILAVGALIGIGLLANAAANSARRDD